MAFSRSMLSVLLILLLLPWGAYAGWAVARAAPLSVSSGSQTEIGTAIKTTSRVTQPRIAWKKGKCRTANLPGSSCATDRALAEEMPCPVNDGRSGVFEPVPNWCIREHATAPPRAPPRLV